MSDIAPWPDLSWEIGKPRLDWLLNRVSHLSKRARAFELALEEAAEAGEAPLSKVADQLADWDSAAANAYMYSGLGEAEQLADADVPSHAEELEKIWHELVRLRGLLLSALGPEAAQKVAAREAAAQVSDALVRERVGEIPEVVVEVNTLTGERTLMPSISRPMIKPVNADEVRMRQSAESKSLPEPATLEALLAFIPSDWAEAIFDTIGLELPEGSTSPRADRRKGIVKHLFTRDFLEALALGLPDEARGLLQELIAEGGSMRYSQVVERHGHDEADGFYWTERAPSGPLAWLRRLGFAFVGQRMSQPHVVVPEDLLCPLKKIFK
jgi:hypothetical protein